MKISEESKKKIQSLLNQRSQIDMALNNYISGLKDGMKLNGDYNFDLNTLSFSKVEKKEAK